MAALAGTALAACLVACAAVPPPEPESASTPTPAGGACNLDDDDCDFDGHQCDQFSMTCLRAEETPKIGERCVLSQFLRLYDAREVHRQRCKIRDAVACK